MTLICLPNIKVIIIGFNLIVFLVATSERPLTINKPIIKTSKPWHFSADYVRCFCNFPSCVTTGYMCKSSTGGCFSDILDQPTSIYRAHHGCLEHLSESEATRCRTRRGTNERTVIRRKENPKSLFLCCHHDMCNHIESPQTKSLINNTMLNDISDESGNNYQQQEEYLYSNSEVWFRAATIAVPICGAVILFVLIVLAVKILKSEQQNSASHKLSPTIYVHHKPQQYKTVKDIHLDCYDRTYDNLLRKDFAPKHNHNVFYSDQPENPQRQAHMPLLLQNVNVCVEKNEANAKFNRIGCDESGKSIICEIEKQPSACSELNIVKYADDAKFSSEKTFLA